MPESSCHANLVRALSTWIVSKYLKGDSGSLLVDALDSDSGKLPPKLEGYIPDAYARRVNLQGVIIGEAKPGRDLETRRSLEQIQAFLKVCARDEDSVLVLAVPWHAVRTAESICRYFKRQGIGPNVKTDVLKRLADK